jgi:hypothetical protein
MKTWEVKKWDYGGYKGRMCVGSNTWGHRKARYGTTGEVTDGTMGEVRDGFVTPSSG